MTGLEIALWVIGGVVVLVGGLLTIAVSIAVPCFGWLVSRLFGRIDAVEAKNSEQDSALAELSTFRKAQNSRLEKLEQAVKDGFSNLNAKLDRLRDSE